VADRRDAPTRLDHVLPGVALLRRYQRAWLRGDVVGGLTVGAMLVPQSMAYAELAGLPPAYGFYAVLGALVVYAAVGTSRHLGVGPEPGTAILAATGVGAIAGDDPDRYLALMAALALVVGAICLVAALLRLGFVAAVLSKPVLVGYITGVALTLVSSQLAGLTGVDVDADRLFPRLGEFVSELDDLDATTTAVGLGTLAVILVLRRAAPRFPGGLATVAAAAVVVAVLGLEDEGVALVGTIPAGLPTPDVPDVSLADLGRLVPVAAGIALVGFTDNLLTARSIAAGRGYRVDANQELLALGLINLTAGGSQGFPVSSSASRTAVPAALGSATQVVSLVAAGFVVASLTVLRPLLEHIPRAALAAVILSAAFAIIDVAGYRSLWAVSRGEAVLAGAAALGVVVFDVLVGVVLAVVLSVVVALHRIARPHDAVLGDAPGLDGWVDADAYPDAVAEPGLLVYRFDAPLFFVNAARFGERVERALLENAGEEEWLIIDCEGIGDVDATALDSVRELLERLRAFDLDVVAVARANDRVLDRLALAGLLAPEGRIDVFPTINAAVRSYRERPA
jgi:high affinity sulfate transporter 1